MSSRRLLVVGLLLVVVGLAPQLLLTLGLYSLQGYSASGVATQVASLVLGVVPFVLLPLGSVLVGAAAVVRHLEERVAVAPEEWVSVDHE